METIGKQDLWSFSDHGGNASVTENRDVRKLRGNYVESYFDLAAKIAELQFRNRDYVLFFRGQRRDYTNDGGRSILPAKIFRREPHVHLSDELPQRFASLREAENQFIWYFRQEFLLGEDEVTRHRLVRWSILQHYEICPTPLLDVTHSLRIAASFASLDNNTDEAFLFVLGVPNISGAISASAEAGIQTVRLSSVCPPSAMRPHLQEGYLFGEYPEIGDYEQKQNYGLPETDFAQRLVAKFRFNPKKFWTATGQFQAIGRRALFPLKSSDQIEAIAEKMRPQFLSKSAR